MNKVKKMVYGAASVALVAPAAVFAQIKTPEGTGLPTGSVTGIIENIMKWLLTMVGILGVIGFVISGILYLTSGGNEDQINRAKRAMIYSIVGVLVALLGLVIFAAMQRMLSAQSSI